MANTKLVHIAHLLQDLTRKFEEANLALARACLTHERMREILWHLDEMIFQETRYPPEDA